MGGSLAVPKVQKLVQALVNETCIISSYVWQGLKPSDLRNVTLSDKEKRVFAMIRAMHPENIEAVIHYTVELFTQTVSSYRNEEKTLRNWCEFVCFICQLTGDNGFWFKKNNGKRYSDKLLESLWYLIDFTEFYDVRKVQFHIPVLRALLYFCYAQSFSSDHTDNKFLQCFESVPGRRLLMKVIPVIPQFLMDSEMSTECLKLCLALMIPCISSFESWSDTLNEIGFDKYHRSFAVLFSVNSSRRVTESCELLVTLLYIVVKKSDGFVKFLSDHYLTNRYIKCLLYIYQRKFETGPTSFFSSVILFLINKFSTDIGALVSLNEPFVMDDFTTKMSLHRGSLADLMIEILSNPIVKNFDDNKVLSPLFASIFMNMSSSTSKISAFAASRVFQVFSMCMKEGENYNVAVDRILLGVFQMIRFQCFNNITMFLFAFKMKPCLVKMENSDHRNWKKLSARILRILEASEEFVRKKDLVGLQNAVTPVLSKWKADPHPFEVMEMADEKSPAWSDWFKVCFWMLFPGEVKRYRQAFWKYIHEEDSKRDTKHVSAPAISAEPAQEAPKTITGIDAVLDGISSGSDVDNNTETLVKPDVERSNTLMSDKKDWDELDEFFSDDE